jgi:hypothetical protein
MSTLSRTLSSVWQSVGLIIPASLVRIQQGTFIFGNKETMLKKINRKVKYNGYVHLQSYDPDSVLEFVGPDSKKLPVDIKGTPHRINVRSLRLQCFKRSKRCVKCGLEGTVMSADTFTTRSDRTGIHFNLYAIYEGKTRLMTKDHTMPKSKGGADHLDNLKTMCDQCNHKKGSVIETETEIVAPFGDTLNIKIGV